MQLRRQEKIKRMVAQRQLDLTVCLENVHDPHNISAVMRTCDAVGIHSIYIIRSDPNLRQQLFEPGKRSASGSAKWVNTHCFDDVATCVMALRDRFDLILATSLHHQAQDLFQVDLTQSMALVFGNEHDGVSDELLGFCDGNFVIPQVGMVPSLNISVACAVTLYEAYRQRYEQGRYEVHPLSADKKQILDTFIRQHMQREK